MNITNTNHTPPQPIQDSGLPDGSVPDGNVNEMHGFSRKLAEEHGINGAIILRYLANRIPSAQAHSNADPGYPMTSRQMAEVHPYVCSGTIADGLAKFRKDGVLKAKNYIKSKFDRTLWYSFANDQAHRDAAAKEIQFKVTNAIRYGVVEAVLLERLNNTWQRLSAPFLAKTIPVSSSTIRRALENLVEHGDVERQKCPGFDQSFQYRLLDKSGLKGPTASTTTRSTTQPTGI